VCVWMCRYPDPSAPALSPARTHVPTHTNLPTYLILSTHSSSAFPHTTITTFPLLSHFTLHHTTYPLSTQHQHRPTPHHTTPFQPLRSTAVGTSTPSTPSPPPTLPLRHACTCTPTRLQRCAPARRSVRVRLCCRVGECKNSDRRGAISGLCCVCRRELR
jgi:hypothetical protein